MTSFTKKGNEIFKRAAADYHVTDNVDTPISNPFEEGTIENMLYLKCWIDTVQWHLEDIIRDPNIDPAEDVTPLPQATINTESPAWALDRLSILAVKIYHMREQTMRSDASEDHLALGRAKLDVLLEQQKDLITAIDQLLDDIQAGRKYMKVYMQMKMYNDPSTNPILYAKKQKGEN